MAVNKANMDKRIHGPFLQIFLMNVVFKFKESKEQHYIQDIGDGTSLLLSLLTEKVAVIFKISPLSLWKLHYLMRFYDAAQAQDIG